MEGSGDNRQNLAPVKKEPCRLFVANWLSPTAHLSLHICRPVELGACKYRVRRPVG